MNGFDVNWFSPDIVTIKHDPFDLIASNFGQPDGVYNWNTNQWNLMNRTVRTCNGCTQGGLHIAIQNLTLFVNDQEFFIKGMCYTPVPLGILEVQGQTGGGGLCSQRRTAFAVDEYKSACFDSDYFHGDNSPGRVPPGPSNGWFTDLWTRDFPIIKASGANTLRVYNANPTTRQYTEKVLSGTATAVTGNIAPPAYGADHVPFMDAAYRAGLMVIFPLLGDQTLMETLPQAEFEGQIMNQIDEVGNHPALLMWTLGNELPIAQDQNLLNLVNTYISFARNYTMSKWGRSIPITHAIVDDPFSYDMLYAQLDVDVFTSNAGYRGLGFSDLWDGSQTPGFSGLGPLSVKYNKPNFVGEMGWMQLNGVQTAQPQNAGWFNIKWKDLIQKGTPGSCIGGAFFEYIDEVYSKADPTQQTMGIVSSRVSSTTNYSATTGSPVTVPALTYKWSDQPSADQPQTSAGSAGAQPSGTNAPIITSSGPSGVISSGTPTGSQIQSQDHFSSVNPSGHYSAAMPSVPSFIMAIFMLMYAVLSG